jgi:hypothetical protein
MNRILIVFLSALFVYSANLRAQAFNTFSLVGEMPPGSGAVVNTPNAAPGKADGPLSRIAIGGGVSPLGIGASLTTNLNSHLNLRAAGSFLNLSVPFNTNGFDVNASLKLASARTSLDIYPFRSGFRISPGLMFYNQNRLTASSTIAGGTSFNLNHDTFYSANANRATGATPVNGTALLGFHATRPAFTLTTGWGNTIPRNGHWSFPLEVGVAFVGAPALDVKLAGWACDDQAQTQCANLSSTTNPIALQVQHDLHVEVNKWTQNLDPLKFYPIISGGVAYSFHTGLR